MKAYIISVAVSTVVCAVINMLTPEKWTKYVSVVTGLVVMVCIASPVMGLLNKDVFTEVSYTAKRTQSEGEAVLYGEIKKELEGRINRDVIARLKTDFMRDCQAVSEVAMTNTGEVTGVKSIYIYGDKIDAVIKGELREIYGAEEVLYIGTEKTASKSE